MNQTSKILFISASFSSFVRKDIGTLSQYYDVIPLVFRSNPKWMVFIEFIRHLLILLFTSSRYKAIVCQFAGYHTLMPVWMKKITGIPVFIICGGTESACFPNIRYGNFTRRGLAQATAWSLRNATHLLPKHHTLMEYENQYDPEGPLKQGILNLVKNFKTPYTVIPNGYADPGNSIPDKRDPKAFLTVAAGIEIQNTIPLKGIDLILSAAPRFPDCTFTIVGVPAGFPLPGAGPNVRTLPPVEHQALETLYNKHSYYLQLSVSEGFPNALCEAMLCGCIPVGSTANSIPDIIGDTGYLLTRRDAGLLGQLIATIISRPPESRDRAAARDRITKLFPLDARGRRLAETIEEYS